MGNGNVPTPAQIRAISNYRLPGTPPTKAVAKRVLDYINEGNTAGKAMDIPSRVALLHAMLDLYVDKAVQHKDTDETGIVLYVVPYQKSEVAKDYRQRILCDGYKWREKVAKLSTADIVKIREQMNPFQVRVMVNNRQLTWMIEKIVVLEEAQET